MRATTRWACVLLLGGLLLGGCAGDVAPPGDGPVADPPPADVDDGPTPAVPGREAPVATPRDPVPALGEDHPLAFRGRQLGGGSVDATELAGGHVVLWLWTPW
jgi:hypothetical protein